MGQQQLLLIVLGVIIVGISILVGIKMFESSAASANLEAVINDLMQLGAKAQQYYLKPIEMDGGGYSFKNLTIQDLTTKPTNKNGTYRVNRARRRRAVLRGDGFLDGDGDNRNCRVILRIFVDSLAIDIRRR